MCTPADALDCFIRSGLDALVLADVVVDGRQVTAHQRAAATATFGSVRPERRLAIYELA